VNLRPTTEEYNLLLEQNSEEKKKVATTRAEAEALVAGKDDTETLTSKL
jgi:hypothetical protein